MTVRHLNCAFGIIWPRADQPGTKPRHVGCWMLSIKPKISSNDPDSVSVGVALLPNFTLTAFSGFIDALRLGSDEGDRSRQNRFKWDVMALDDAPVRSSCGVHLNPTARLDEVKHYDYFVIVGGLLREDSRINSSKLLNVIKHYYTEGCSIVGICNGVFALAQTRLLDGRTCAVSWFHAEEFSELYENVIVDTKRQCHRDGRILTCAGGVGAMHLGVFVVRAHVGNDVADKCARILMFDDKDRLQAAQPTRLSGVTIRHPKLREALLELELKCLEKIDYAAVALNVGMSLRHLERLFKNELGKTPRELVIEWRIDEAKAQIRDTHLSIAQIAFSTGFSNQSHFSSTFRSLVGCLPSDFRENLTRQTDRS